MMVQQVGSHWPFSLSPLEHGAFVFAGLLVYVLVTRIGHQRRHPSAAIAWVLLIMVLPYFGVPLFLLLGTRKFARAVPRVRSEVIPGDLADAPRWAVQLLATLDVQPLVRCESVDFHADGAASQQALFTLIEGAQQRIDLCTYVLAPDEVGAALSDALTRSAARGVHVRLLLDAIGSRVTSRRQLRALREAGATVRWFMPVLHNPRQGRTNLRSHRKLVVVDGAQVWSGGRNLAAEYFIDRPGAPAWVDLSFVVRGALAEQAHLLFEQDWQAAGGGRPPSGATVLHLQSAASGVPAQWVPSGPDHADDTVYSLLLAGAYQAGHSIVLVTPYFVPDDALLSAWCMACRRGVRLTLLIPVRSNHRLADWARERALRALAEAGGVVLLYPAMLHAKAVVIDGQLALCGSANLDGRSLFINYELMTAFYGREQIAWISDWIERHARLATIYRARTPSLPRDVIEGVVRAVGFQL